MGDSCGDELAAEAVGWPFLRVGPRALGKEFGNENGNDDAENGDGDENGNGDGEGEGEPTEERRTAAAAAAAASKKQLRPDALGRISTPLPRLTVLDLVRASGALGGG